jgi:uncharacterized protein
LRQSWKEFGLGLLNLLLVILVITLSQPLLQKYIHAAGPAVMALLVLMAYGLGSLYIERRTPVELAPSRAVPEILGGLGIGISLFCSVMGVLWAIGSYHASGWGHIPNLPSTVVFTVLAGVLEEILFRGLLFRLFSRLVGTWSALLVTAAFFGAAHAGNRGATVGSSVAIAIEAGILLGASYAMTNRLWLPIGLHIGWNFSEGAVFGMTLSGNAMEPGMIRGTLQGPSLLTGGAFGPEASLIAVLLCFTVAFTFLFRAIKLRRMESPAWVRAKQSQPATPWIVL